MVRFRGYSDVKAAPLVLLFLLTVAGSLQAKKKEVSDQPLEVTVNVEPQEVKLDPGTTTQFSAVLTHTSIIGVNWAISPALGKMTLSGRYTAPQEIPFPQNVTVTATALADRSKTSTATIHLTPPPFAPKQVSIELKVLFDTNQAVVKPEYRADIQRVAEFMKDYTHTQAEIEGHCDDLGSPAQNLSLSQRRADAVRKVLVEEFGVAANRLTAKGYGDTRPVADNKTETGRAKNRRVVATLTAMTLAPTGR